MIKISRYKDKTVAVLGLGLSGTTVVKALLAGGAHVVGWDDNEEVRQFTSAMGYTVKDLNQADNWKNIELLVVSPGIPYLYPEPHPAVKLAWNFGVFIDNDVGLFFRADFWSEMENYDVKPKIIAITGSNGKSTTTAMINHILNSFGHDSEMGGNIGKPVLDLSPIKNGDIKVLELSSYQLELASVIHSDVSVFVNFSKDHLDRHGGVGGYFAAKSRLFDHGNSNYNIVGVDEPEGRFIESKLRREYFSNSGLIPVSVESSLISRDWGVFLKKNFLVEWKKGRQIYSIDLRTISNIFGKHNKQNACLAYATCRTLGLAPRQIEKSFSDFRTLPHRSNLVAKKNGVDFVDDSKATNANAAEKSLSSFSNIRWIVGGIHKDGGIESLKHLFPKIKKSYLIGESSEIFSKTLHDYPYEICKTLIEAVNAAHKDAEPGDTILLAPACASFDQFRNFQERGLMFCQLVEAL